MLRPALAVVTVALGAMILLPPGVQATPFDEQAKILLHVKGLTTKNACDWGQLANCTEATVSGLVGTSGGPFYYVYLLVARGNQSSIAGLQCGLFYEGGAAQGATDRRGVDIFGWTLCATLEFATPAPWPLWPNPRSGNLITWDSLSKCQTRETAVAGYFYAAAYGPDTLMVIPRPVDGQAKVADCGALETLLRYSPQVSDLGYVVFSVEGTTAGCNPCVQPCPALTVPVEPTTWSSIKAIYSP